jgi:hypothetical protein
VRRIAGRGYTGGMTNTMWVFFAVAVVAMVVFLAIRKKQ